MKEQKPLSYKDAGVNIDKGNEFVKKIAPLIKSTHRPEVLTGIGGYSGLFSINKLKYEEPVLVSSTDGIGTKLKLALETGIFSGLGQDLVAMCVNDILCVGAEPLFFLDYYAVGKLDIEKSMPIMKSMTDCLAEINCALIGGETAEMPGVYSEGDFDMAGFAIGMVNRSEIIDGSSISRGNHIIGIASSGVHSNGYSLVRKIIEHAKLDLHTRYSDLENDLAQILLTPTKIYVNPILHIKNHYNILGLAHITGGGILENLPRILPQSCKAIIQTESWTLPSIFKFLQEKGQIETEEMLRVFNCGIGMALVCKDNESTDILAMLESLGEKAYLIGEIELKKEGESSIQFQES